MRRIRDGRFDVDILPENGERLVAKRAKVKPGGKKPQPLILARKVRGSKLCPLLVRPVHGGVISADHHWHRLGDHILRVSEDHFAMKLVKDREGLPVCGRGPGVD